MAVYGVGAYFGYDVSKEFIKNNCVCIGHAEQDAPSLYELLRRAKIGDIIYIKSYTPRKNNQLCIKAIGYIIGANFNKYNMANSNDGFLGRSVRWVKDFTNNPLDLELKKEDRINNVYCNTIYEEYSSELIYKILDLLAK